MYPFGSGMPQPPSNAPYGQHQNQTPPSVPFGAGWIAPSHYQQSPAQSPLHYQSIPHNTPYPSNTSYHYQQQQQHHQHQHQHHAQATQQQHPSPYPPSGAPYMGSSYPHNPHNPQQSPYPQPNTSAYHHQYPPQHNPLYTHPPDHPSYAPTHGYRPVPGGAPAENLAHCFDELAERTGHPHPHTYHLPFIRNEHAEDDCADDAASNGERNGDTDNDNDHESDNDNEQDDFSSDHDETADTVDFESAVTGTPTVFPAQNFDPVTDAHSLRKAMKGFGTDEDALINIICRRTNEQRQEIQRQYKTHFGKDLIEDIKSETSGNFEKLLVGLLRPIVDFYCVELKDAMVGIGTDEDVLIEILCTLSNMEIHTIKSQYLRLYGEHLESQLKGETSGNFKRLLTSLCTAARDESGRTDQQAAENDARELLRAGELRVGTDESMFNMVLCQRNYQQLKLVFQEYERMTGHTLEKAIEKEFSGDIKEGLMAICKCVSNKAEYFASRLHKAMAGIGTNDRQLIRIIITRCEIDMADIKATFERMYGKSLKSWVKGDTSGHYKHALYALIGEQRSS